MATTNSRIAYADCLDLFDKALEDDRGIRVGFSSQGEALQYRVRMHAARQINRDDNRETFDADHPMHGQSEYDKLVCKVKQVAEKWYLYIEKAAAPTDVESLSEQSEA